MRCVLCVSLLINFFLSTHEPSKPERNRIRSPLATNIDSAGRPVAILYPCIACDYAARPRLYLNAVASDMALRLRVCLISIHFNIFISFLFASLSLVAIRCMAEMFRNLRVLQRLLGHNWHFVSGVIVGSKLSPRGMRIVSLRLRAGNGAKRARSGEEAQRRARIRGWLVDGRVFAHLSIVVRVNMWLGVNFFGNIKQITRLCL